MSSENPEDGGGATALIFARVVVDLPTRALPEPFDYAVPDGLESVAQVVNGFREIQRAGHDCRFANCRHLQEPGCAVKAAVEAGTIDARRYESYRRALRLLPRGPA